MLKAIHKVEAERLFHVACTVARKAHEGQMYAGKPYYEGHVQEVIKRMGVDDDTATADDYVRLTIAALHDVLEDSEVTYAELAAIFPYRITKAVEYLTRRPGDHYYVYLCELVGFGPLDALYVKRADAMVNYGTSWDAKDPRRVKKYSLVIDLIEARIKEKEEA